jgi:hypothetical protein
MTRNYGADDGIRTRDPHLGKVALRVSLGAQRVVICASVRQPVRQSRRFLPCRRALYYDIYVARLLAGARPVRLAPDETRPSRQ